MLHTIIQDVTDVLPILQCIETTTIVMLNSFLLLEEQKKNDTDSVFRDVSSYIQGYNFPSYKIISCLGLSWFYNVFQKMQGWIREGIQPQ